MTSETFTSSPAPGDDLAIICVLTGHSGSAKAFERQLARQLLPHVLHHFEDAEALTAFVDVQAQREERPVDAIVLDLRKFAAMLPALAKLRGQQGFLVAAYPADAVDTASIDTARAAGALVLAGDLNERDGVLRFTEALVDRWFDEAKRQSRSRSAK